MRIDSSCDPASSTTDSRAASRDSLANPAALDYFVELARAAPDTAIT